MFFGVPATGSFAEKALVEERDLAPLPDAIDFELGATIGVAYLTSVRAIMQLCAAQAFAVGLLASALFSTKVLCIECFVMITNEK